MLILLPGPLGYSVVVVPHLNPWQPKIALSKKFLRLELGIGTMKCPVSKCHLCPSRSLRCTLSKQTEARYTALYFGEALEARLCAMNLLRLHLHLCCAVGRRLRERERLALF